MINAADWLISGTKHKGCLLLPGAWGLPALGLVQELQGWRHSAFKAVLSSGACIGMKPSDPLLRICSLQRVLALLMR